MTKPKIVHMVTSPLTAQAFLRGQLSYFREQGFDVTLISSPGAELDTIAAREGIATVAIPMRREPSPWHDAVSLSRLIRTFRALRPDIVHCGTPKASLLGGIAAWIAGVPIRLMTLHGMRADGLKQPARAIVLGMERLSCRVAHRVYCVGPSLQRRAWELKLAKPEKLKVLAQGTANGIDTRYFSRSPEVLSAAGELQKRLGIEPNAPLIGFVGRLVRDKGVAELIAAFQQLKSEFPGIKLLLVGPFEEYDGISDELRAAIAGDSQIIQLGFLKDPRPAYALMTVLSLPTYREGFPYVPMEAAAMGIPVVATHVTGCVDAVVPEVTGLLIPPRDSQALTASLRRYLNSPEMRLAHGLAGRSRVVRDFAPEVIWKSQLQEYAELLHAHRRANLITEHRAPSQGFPLAIPEPRE